MVSEAEEERVEDERTQVLDYVDRSPCDLGAWIFGQCPFPSHSMASHGKL